METINGIVQLNTGRDGFAFSPKGEFESYNNLKNRYALIAIYTELRDSINESYPNAKVGDLVSFSGNYDPEKDTFSLEKLSLRNN